MQQRKFINGYNIESDEAIIIRKRLQGSLNISINICMAKGWSRMKQKLFLREALNSTMLTGLA